MGKRNTFPWMDMDRVNENLHFFQAHHSSSGDMNNSFKRLFTGYILKAWEANGHRKGHEK